MKLYKKTAAALILIILISTFFSACSAGMHTAEIVVEGYGSIFVELDGKTAPITVRNFIKLAKAGFYDGLTFHRIIPGFVLQGGNGEPAGKTAGSIKGEFAANGVNNSISHRRGVISMARVDGYNDSASSQFFIMVGDNTGLNGQYAAFGRVTEGMDIVDQIVANAVIYDSNGSVLPENQPVIKTIKID